MPAPKRRTWVLVADGGRARILVNEGVGKGLHPALPTDFASPNPPTREQGTDRPGRVFDSLGPGRHAMVPRVDWHRFEKETFARDVARELDRGAMEASYHRLILIAPPTTLGDLRAALGEKARRLVIGEIPKDLTQLPEAEIGPHLDGIIAV
jgi:protein required for attachment to host cells